MDIKKIKARFARLSLVEFAFQMGYHAVNKIAPLIVIKGMTLTLENAGRKLLDEGRKYETRFLTAAECQHYAALDDYIYTPEFARTALAKGDECFGVFVEGTLASYGWYSARPTKLVDGLELYFSNDYQYMYAGYTLPAYRGLRLHAIGMALAARAYTERGLKGLISCVEAHNFDSLRSCRRLGYQEFGSVTALRLFRRHLIIRTRRCEDYGFGVQPLTPAVAEGLPGQV